ncbi:MAG TPA: flagellar export protein FliJ [Bacillota bacterium]|nr:flagellar export protein FliJ [Bacillota bacterium]
MSQLLSLEKILHVKENEKNEAQLKHHRSVEAFEKVALNLYEKLKKKETAEQLLDETLQKKMTITELREQSTYIEQLKREIIAIQEEVNEARALMEHHKANLTNKHIEFKKIEKIIELRREKIKAKEKREENILMDEISIQQYMSQKNR